MIIKFKQMKNTVLFLTLLVVFSGAFSQENLVLNTACGGEQQTYVYKELYEGRASYVIGAEACSQLSSESRCVNDFTSYYIRWSGSQWEWVEVVRSGTSCVWLVQICVPFFSDENADVIPPVILSETVLATNSANTSIPPRYGWVVSDGNCMPTIISGYSDPLPVTISGTYGGTYDFLEDFNGKPKYRYISLNCSDFSMEISCENIVGYNQFDIQWNGSHWEWGASGECNWYFLECGSNDDETKWFYDPQFTVFATNVSTSIFPPIVGWIKDEEADPIPVLTSGYSCNIIDQEITTCAGSQTITLNSQTGVNYSLVNEDDEVVDGPLTGTGVEITLNTGVVSGAQTFKVLVVSSSDPDNCRLELSQQVTIESTFAGLGTVEDPYEIASLNDLQILSENLCLWDKHFKQTADIDASSTSGWNEGEGFITLGNGFTSFTGTYDGNSKIISNLYINRPTQYHVGFIGNLSNSGKLSKLSLTSVNITGFVVTAGAVGYNWGEVSEVFVSGIISGDNTVGGVLGRHMGSGNLINSYSTASVTATSSRAGGLVGFLDGGPITNCYVSANVSSDGVKGGLTSDHEDMGVITSSYWNTDLYADDNGFGSGKNGNELRDQSNFIDWDFDNIWKMGVCSNNGYPIFKWQGAVCPTQLISEDCSRDLNYLDEQITFENIPDVNTYQIRVQGTNGNTLNEVIERTHATLRTFRLHVVPGIEFGKTYDISVRGFVNGTWDEYGDVCQITTPQNTAVIYTECGKVVTKRDELVNFRAVPGARTYKIRLQGPNGYDVVRTRSDKRFKLDLFPNIMNGATYIVTIAWSTTQNANPTNNELWSSYGEACELKTLFPIKLNNASCGATFYSRNDVMRFDFINGVSNYQVYITADGGFERTVNVTAPSNGVRFINVKSMLLGRTYNVQVRAQLNGTWSKQRNVHRSNEQQKRSECCKCLGSNYSHVQCF
jgi:hypothetical protein